MNSNTTNEKNLQPLLAEIQIDEWKFAKKTWNYRRLILKACCMGTIIGLIIVLGTPKEYTASTLVIPEGYSRNSSSSMNMLADMAGVNVNTSSISSGDAIFPALYPAIVKSTPFLIGLFDVEVCGQKDGIIMPLSQYLKEYRKTPWWSIIASAPVRMANWTLSLFKEKPKIEKKKNKIDIFQLAHEEAGMVGAIASRITVGVDKKKKAITISVTMQNPLVAAIVADTVRARLKEYITEYRTAKARRNLKYAENLCKEAQMKYYNAQEKYTRYADANQGLVKLASRSELVGLQNEMNLSFTIYNQLEQQVQVARAKVEKIKPVFAIIQPVQVPLSPSKPRAMMILAVCIFLSGAVSIGWVLFGKDFLKNLKKERNNPKERMQAED